jgi:flagellar biosynthetic protein FliR
MDAVGLALDRWGTGLVLGAARAVPIAWVVPAFGGRTLPLQARLGLGLGMAVLATPLLSGLRAPVPSAVALVLLLAREILVGVALGFVAAGLFRAAALAGRLAEGALVPAAEASPGPDGDEAPLGRLHLLLAIVVFFELGGPVHLVAALARSYEVLPVAGDGPGLAHAGGAGVIGVARIGPLVMRAAAHLLATAVGLAAPVLAAVLLAELAVVAASRLAAAPWVASLAAPVRTLAGLMVLLLALTSLARGLGTGWAGWLRLLDGAAALGR